MRGSDHCGWPRKDVPVDTSVSSSLVTNKAAGAVGSFPIREPNLFGMRIIGDFGNPKAFRSFLPLHRPAAKKLSSASNNSWQFVPGIEPQAVYKSLISGALQ